MAGSTPDAGAVFLPVYGDERFGTPCALPLAMTRTFLFLGIILTLGLLSAGDARADRVRGCSDEAQANLTEAVRFLDNNMDALKNAPVDMGRKRAQRRRVHRKMDKKLGKVRWTCDWEKRCPGNQNLYGNQSRVRQIRLCYSNMVARNATFCDFVDTVAHEFGHRVGLPKSKQHNNFSDPTRREDSVYKFGAYAGQMCRDAGLDRPLDPSVAMAALFERLRKRRAGE